MSKSIPDVDFELVLNKAKRGSFEIFVVNEKDGEKKQIWTGINKGPPRKDKFPDVEKDLKAKVFEIVTE